MLQTLLLVAVVRVSAQPPASMVTLSMPPASAGTCMPARAVKSDSTTGPLRGALLVMVSRVPGSRREIAVYVDASGTLRRYSDRTELSTRPGAGEMQSVIAGATARGEWKGVMLTVAMTMQPPSGMDVLDTAKLRAMRENAKSTTSNAVLTPAQLNQARTVGAAIIARCGAK